MLLWSLYIFWHYLKYAELAIGRFSLQRTHWMYRQPAQ